MMMRVTCDVWCKNITQTIADSFSQKKLQNNDDLRIAIIDIITQYCVMSRENLRNCVNSFEKWWICAISVMVKH